MLDLTKIQLIAQSYSPQELFAALVWQRQFNQFNGEQVITDLASRTDLWASFLFTKPIFAPDENGLSFGGVIDTLLAMANYRPMPQTSIIHFVAYPGAQPPTINRLSDLRSPTLFIIGTEDMADNLHTAELFQQVPNIRFAWIEGADHMPTLTHPETICRLIGEFLSE